MPTFGLSEEEVMGDGEYLGDDDMYWRRYRLPSMQVVLEKMSARAFSARIQRQNESEREAAKYRLQYQKESEKKMEDLEKLYISSPKKVIKTPSKKIDYDTALEKWRREYEHPSSSAQINADILLPSASAALSSNFNDLPKLGKSKLGLGPSPSINSDDVTKQNEYSFLNDSDHSFNSQPIRSFKIDHYDGMRPSFLLSHGATSTPLSKFFPKPKDVLKEEDDETTNTMWTTAPEVPTNDENVVQSPAVREPTNYVFGSNAVPKALSTVPLPVHHPSKSCEGGDTEALIEPINSISTIFAPELKLQTELANERSNFEENSDRVFKSLLKRTIGEKISVFTRKETPRGEIEEVYSFFKKLLNKVDVNGFNDETLQLETLPQLHFAIHDIIDKYMNIVVQDQDLIPSASHVVSRLCCSVKRFEKCFIGAILNQSVVLRQVAEERFFNAYFQNLSSQSKDERAVAINREKSLVSFFLRVHGRNAFFANAGRKLYLNNEMLWKISDLILENSTTVRRSSILLHFLLNDSVCKSNLAADAERWAQYKEKLQHVLQELRITAEEHGFDELSGVILLQEDFAQL